MPALSSWEAHMAIQQSRISFLEEQFHQNKFDPNTRFRGQTLLTTSVFNRNRQTVCFLLDLGANPNLKSVEGGRYETPLITAVRLKDLQLVKILIENGAKISATNFYGQDAIFHAVEENGFDILEYLLTCSSGLIISENDHEPSNVCPFYLALTESSLYHLKRKSLLLLIAFNYNCRCLKRLVQRIYAKQINCHEVPAPDSIIVDHDIIQWLFLGHSTFFQPRILAFEGNGSISRMIKLQYLSRHTIRTICSSRAVKNKCSIVQIIQAIPLPSKLIHFLLLKDF